jgi:uncharacterized protein YodC (DUF2158 family)
MTKETFKEGDPVRLKSGGPNMTIRKFAFNELTDKPYTDRVVCTWFDDNNVKKEATFETVLLVHI